MSSLFQFGDPVASFEPGSPGAKSQRITGSWGDQLGVDAWLLGKRAYERLRAMASGKPTVKGFLRFIEDEKNCFDGFFEALNKDALTGRIVLVQSDGETPVELPVEWQDSEWSWKATTFFRFVSSLPSTREPGLELFVAHMLMTALLHLDTAALYSLDDNSAGVSKHLLDAAWLVERVESLERAELDAKALLARLEKARASERAKLRHAQDPKRGARDFVYQCWVAWRKAPGTYPSASAFARAMLDKHPDLLTSEVVVARWVRKWNREGQGSTPQ
jgi:hypothetical protein